jgi:hypothetical protein
MNFSPNTTAGVGISVAALTIRELQGRIEASHLEAAYSEMAFDLCLAQVSLQEAFAQIQGKALEHMVGLLDSRILEDEALMKVCLEMIAEEAESVAWNALQRANEALRDGLAILDGREEVEGTETVH